MTYNVFGGTLSLTPSINCPFSSLSLYEFTMQLYNQSLTVRDNNLSYQIWPSANQEVQAI